MPIVQCPYCDEEFETRKAPGQRCRCPECGATFAATPTDLLDDDEDDDFRPRRSIPSIRRRPFLYRFINGTTIGAAIGFVCVTAPMFFVLANERNTPALGALCGSMCVGVVGATLGLLAGWFVDTVIHGVKAATRDDAPRRRRRDDDDE